jgi:MHS family shikimate/dehydroshikimate transporter-like MFS transporter
MTSNDQTSERSSIRQVVAASFIGTTIEWYDFFLYGTAAALVFNKLFFPKVEPSSGTLLALATYGVGFAARPLGGIIFGHYGDRIGRKTMLVLSLLIMGIATFFIGLMPTYAAIGIWAPIILVVLRIAQGIGVGGEWGGAVLMSVEHAPPGRRGFFGSWPQMGVPAGLFLSTVVFLIVQQTTSDEAFLSWGWRIPFLLSAILVGVGLFVRLRLYESPAFQRIKDTKTEAPMPILDVLRKYPREVLLAMGMRIAENGTFYILTVWVLVYGNEELKLAKSTMLWGVVIAALIGLITIPWYGALSDRVGRRPLYLGGALFSLLFAFPFFWLVNTKTEILIWLAIILGVNVGHDLMYGGVLLGAVRHQSPLQRRLARLPAGLGVRRRLRPAGRGRVAEGLGLAGRGRLHGRYGRGHGGRDPARHRNLPARHRHRRPARTGAGLGAGQPRPRSSCLSTLPRALRGNAST